MEAATATAVGQATMAPPSTTDAYAVLEAAAPISVRGAARCLEEPADHLTAHPDALIPGSSLCPPVLLRLTEVLHASGRPPRIRPSRKDPA
ncbi:hypothetical protein AB0F03_35545 [Streptomyces sp. NPDC028722]|uniref:hypothetical protein n=1 Tax=Streptomyces sp. NPDC028722 TaxID=3155016 RepID=UPI0033D0488D